MERESSSRRRPGRPPSFDRGAALRAAMLAFWRHGYEGTSLAELTAAMGISPPSLYAAFGDKRALFLEAVRLYAGDAAEQDAAAAAAPSARAAAEALLRASALAFTGEATPPGCLVASAAASGPETSAEVREALAAVRRATAARLRRRIERDVAEGALPADADPEALAGLVVAVVQGLSALARDGAGRGALLAVVEQALQGWPERPGR